MKVVINCCFGGFGLSYKAMMRYAELMGIKLYAVTDDRSYEFNPKIRKLEYHDGSKGDWRSIYYLTEPLLEDGTSKEDSHFSIYDMDRTDPILIQVVEELGREADGDCAELKVVEIPDNIEWEISNYDGQEIIHEVHRRWS